MLNSEQYRSNFDELKRRIHALAEAKPEVLMLNDPWKLFDHGLKLDGLDVTAAQASFALSDVKRERLGGR